jgi:hypothetical protein
MTEPVRPLEALIEKWNECANFEAESNLQYAQALSQCADELAALLQAAAPPAPTAEPPAKVKQAVFLYLNTLVITSDNIGDIRRSLFMPFDCKWNGWVRDMTAELENKSSCAAPPERVSEGKEPVLSVTAWRSVSCPNCDSHKQERIAGLWLCQNCGNEWNPAARPAVEPREERQ